MWPCAASPDLPRRGTLGFARQHIEGSTYRRLHSRHKVRGGTGTIPFVYVTNEPPSTADSTRPLKSVGTSSGRRFTVGTTRTHTPSHVSPSAGLTICGCRGS